MRLRRRTVLGTGAAGVLLGAPTRRAGASPWGGDHDAPALPVEAPPPGTQHNPPLINGVLSRGGVHTLTGSFVYAHTDASASGRGPVPVIVRTYNSNDPRPSPLGPGWTHSYAMRLVDPGDGSGAVVLVGPLGRSDRYAPVGNGAFAPPASVISELARHGSGPDTTYVVTHRDQSTWRFGVIGRLLAVANRYGDTSPLRYDDDTGQLAAVGDPAGRGELAFATDSTTGRLTSVADWLESPRVDRFDYNDLGRLRQVTDREEGRTTFGYNGASHRLATIVDPRDVRVLSMTYDRRGRVESQTDAAGYVTTYSYNG